MANALGAVASRRIARVTLTVHAVYVGQSLTGYEFPDEGRRRFFRAKGNALRYAREAIERMVRKKAELNGIEGEPVIALTEKEVRTGAGKAGLILDVRLAATATEA